MVTIGWFFVTGPVESEVNEPSRTLMCTRWRPMDMSGIPAESPEPEDHRPDGRIKAIVRRCGRAGVIGIMAVTIAMVASIAIGAAWSANGGDGDKLNAAYNPLAIVASFIVAQPGLLNLRPRKRSNRVSDGVIRILALIAMLPQFLHQVFFDVIRGL